MFNYEFHMLPKSIIKLYLWMEGIPGKGNGRQDISFLIDAGRFLVEHLPGCLSTLPAKSQRRLAMEIARNAVGSDERSMGVQ